MDELSKVLDKGTTQHSKDMYRTIKYVLKTKGKALCIEPSKIPQNPKKNWIIEVYAMLLSLEVMYANC